MLWILISTTFDLSTIIRNGIKNLKDFICIVNINNCWLSTAGKDHGTVCYSYLVMTPPSVTGEVYYFPRLQQIQFQNDQKTINIETNSESWILIKVQCFFKSMDLSQQALQTNGKFVSKFEFIFLIIGWKPKKKYSNE